MKNFIIFFMANTGSSAIISHLKQLKNKIDIIGFEPFDNCHMKTPLIGEDLTKIFNLVYSKNHKIDDINNIYKKYSNKELDNIDTTKSVGFKMRYRNLELIEQPLKNNNVVILVLIRKNVFKWALSTYDSKSTQFKLIRGEISKDPEITVDINKFKDILNKCEKSLDERYKLINTLKSKGLNVYPIYYEDYCNDKENFFKKFFNYIDINLSTQELSEFANKPNFFKKVHSDDIKQYVTNYDELKKEFGQKYNF